MKLRTLHLLVFVALAGCQGTQSPLDALEITAPQTLSAADTAAVRATVGLQVNDPSSAVITNLASSRTSSGMLYVCGIVNGKSSNGTDLGARRFYGSLATDARGARIFVLIGLGNNSSAAIGAGNTCDIRQ